MEYTEAKTDTERWSILNAARPPAGIFNRITTTSTDLCEQSDIVLAPIYQLPRDVLYDIFTICCRKNIDTVRLPYNRSNVAPQITISHVCSTWRHIILNVPSFWNAFEVSIDHAEDGGMVMEIVYDWLLRANNLSCALALNFKADDSTLAPGAIKAERWYRNIVKYIIAPFRFKRLSMPWLSNHWMQFLRLPAENLSCIEELHICCINPPCLSDFGDLPSQVPLDNFKKLTKLTSLRVDHSMRRAFRDAIYSKDSVFMHLPWNQLCHIHLTIPTSAQFCLDILQCSSIVLETCSFVVSSYEEVDPWHTPLHCPQLRTLKLVVKLHPSQYFSPPILDEILLSIKIPKLKALTVGLNDDTSRAYVHYTTLVQMRQVSNMQLEEFTLHNRDIIMSVRDVLATFPSLKRVELLGPAFVLDEQTIDELGSGLVGSCLEEFIIQCGDIDVGKLLQTIKLRSCIRKRGEWQGDRPTPFKYVKILRWTEVPEQYKESIKEINRRDVQLVVEPWDQFD